MKRILWLAAAVVLLGCAKPAQTVSDTSNAKFKIELLFEHDGVKVYRFQDFGRDIYYVTPAGRTEWRAKQGKSSTRQSVETLEAIPVDAF